MFSPADSPPPLDLEDTADFHGMGGGFQESDLQYPDMVLE